jgi:DNA-nicking Smr family endonuclease
MPSSRIRHLADLAHLRDALEQETLLREQRERAAQRAAADAEREANLFRNAVGAVEPLKVGARVRHQHKQPEPIAHQYRRDEAEALAESISDLFNPDSLLETDEQLSWRREGVSPDVLQKLRRGHWVIQSEVDLHGARVDGAREMVTTFLRESIKHHHRCVRIVHGKGHGSIGKQPVLKGKVKTWLVQKDEVMAFCQAREHDGGGGALIVLLRPS